MFGKKRAYINGMIAVVLLMGTLAGYGVQPAQADGGAYSLAFSAADPLLYIPPVPLPEFHPPVVGGRYDGEGLIPGAWYTQPGGVKTSVESLNPREMALCQIVPFEIEISVGVGAAAADLPITFVTGWNIDTTNNSPFGYDEAYGVYSAFVDTGDGSHNDPGGNATVSYTWSVVGDEIQGVFNVSGLEAGDVVVVEPWLVLDCTLPDKVGGNVQSRLISAQTATGDAISTGNQTVPLLQVGQFTSIAVDLNVVKTDDDLFKFLYEPFYYDITVSFPLDGSEDTIANDVVVIDTLDPWLEYLSNSPVSIDPIFGYEIDPAYNRTCTWVDDNTDGLGGTVTCDLGAVIEGETTSIRIWVRAVEGAPLDGLIETGTCVQGIDDLVDVCNLVSLETISNDTNLANNSDSEPKDIVYPTAVDVGLLEAEAQMSSILVSWETFNEMDILGFNLYRTTNPDGSGLIKINPDIIGTIYLGSSGQYDYIDHTAQFGITYYYNLEVIYFSTNTAWLDTVSTMLLHKTFLPVTVK